MTFTYTPASPTDVTRVRFHIGDTDSTAAIFSDEEIEFITDENSGSWQRAVIACIEAMIAKASNQPDFKADWLQVDGSKSIAGLKTLLSEKRRALGVASLVATSVHVYRADSNLTESPDWAGEAEGGS